MPRGVEKKRERANGPLVRKLSVDLLGCYDMALTMVAVATIPTTNVPTIHLISSAFRLAMSALRFAISDFRIPKSDLVARCS